MRFQYLLKATGGVPGGGWDSELGFRQLARGFSVWISDGKRFTLCLKSNRTLDWRTACQEMRSFKEGWISCDYRNITGSQGIIGWQSELLGLSSLNDEDFGFGNVIDQLLQFDEQDIEIIYRSVGSFYDDVLIALQDVFSLCPGNPLKTWEMLGGNNKNFVLTALLERLEEARDQMIYELDEIAKPFEQQISIFTRYGAR